MIDKNKTTHTPRWLHDCPSCKYLGTRHDQDVYVCPTQITGPSVIVRFGPSPEAYSSGAVFVTAGMFFRGEASLTGDARSAAHWTNVAAAILAEYAIAKIVEEHRA